MAADVAAFIQFVVHRSLMVCKKKLYTINNYLRLAKDTQNLKQRISPILLLTSTAGCESHVNPWAGLGPS